MKTPPIRFAVIGAGRGKTFVRATENPEANVELVAICDTNPAALEPWKDMAGVALYTSYEQVLNDPNVDAVCLATPVNLHARQAISALDAGKHVLSEVTATYTLDECWDLIAAVKRSGRTYMMAENYCYIESVLQVQNMVERGVFGDITYASGSYIHDCRNLLFTPEGDLTWRGILRRDIPPANGYPTHSLGPIARWLDINRSDFFQTTATWQSPSRAIRNYATRHHAERTALGEPGFWAHADTVTTCIRTGKEVLIDLRVDSVSPRPHNMTRYELQGTRASFSWPDGLAKEPLIWIEDRSPANERGIATEWEPLSKYREEFEHPLWRDHREAASKTGHGGGDYFILREFAASIREERLPLIDVYDAVTWSSIIPLSAASIGKGNIPMTVPDFKGERP
jgi:predicted dehydrogenase